LNLVAETLNASDIELARPVIVEVLTTLEGLKDERFEPLLDELAKKADGEKALTVLISASYQFGIKQRYRPMLACTERAERLARHLVEIEGQWELENDLAMALMNKGVALSDLGHPKEAIDCYDEVIGIYRRLVEVEGRVELANELAMALVNKGNALWALGRHKEAIDCCEEAIKIRRRLVEVEGRVELANELAMALVNKGVALSALGRLSEAIDCYEEAIGIYRRLVKEGRVELENDLAMALVNKGNALRNLGRLSEALEYYNEGIGLWERIMNEGQMYVIPFLIVGLSRRFILKCRMRNWGGAAKDVSKLLACVVRLVRSQNQLTEEEWKALASAARMLRW
jgi:tetratricopeptide (TPR) repeat protein